MTKMSAPAAVTVWSPVRTTYLSTTTTTRLARFTSVSCVTRKALSRLDKGGLPGCVEVCPAGAVIFGTREELMAEAKKRLALKPGSEYHYPRQTLKTDDTYLHTVPKYYPHLYGEKEGRWYSGAGADRRSL
ncbi:hydrogenase-2 small subunit [Salmonella enterica subsp. enterica]|uniref:Hydrogenase-2 small subunit n=1 Tax=Salmonella enterica I TaxID=59201 RepID=A0A379WMP8_SALET|nr:hydrogenase-2 small subunit [Salmonella enterica subsp. enterica]